MGMYGLGAGRGRLWLVLVAALCAALVSLLALLQSDRTARADERANVRQVTLEPGSSAGFQSGPDEAVDAGTPGTDIVGGTTVPDRKYPFMTIMEVERSDGSSILCGGSLIDSNSVLTAGHCLLDVQAVTLAVGRTVISQPQGQLRFAVDVFFHPRYNPNANSSYDAAVIKLDRKVTGVKPIALATAKQNGLETPGRRLTVAGWGATSEGGAGTDRMREASVPVVSDDKARRAYSNLQPIYQYFPFSMVAAGVGGKDSCQGDSGGPLFKLGATRTQVGIVSYGFGCARARFPGAYTEVNNPGIRSFIVNAAKL